MEKNGEPPEKNEKNESQGENVEHLQKCEYCSKFFKQVKKHYRFCKEVQALGTSNLRRGTSLINTEQATSSNSTTAPAPDLQTRKDQQVNEEKQNNMSPGVGFEHATSVVGRTLGTRLPHSATLGCKDLLLHSPNSRISESKTNAGANWTTAAKEELMRCYILSEPNNRGWGKRLLEHWLSRGNEERTQIYLTNQTRSLLKRDEFSQHQLELLMHPDTTQRTDHNTTPSVNDPTGIGTTVQHEDITNPEEAITTNISISQSLEELANSLESENRIDSSFTSYCKLCEIRTF